MKPVSVILAPLVLVACLHISHCFRVALPVEGDKEIDIYYIRGILHEHDVKYPAVVINKRTLLAGAKEPLESPLICFKHDCTPPKHSLYQDRYAFWTVASNTSLTVPKIFKGNITRAYCTLNDDTEVTIFKRSAKTRNVYTCIGKCKVHDVVVCNNEVAGFLEKTKTRNAFLIRDITTILRNFNRSRKRKSRSGNLKVFTVKPEGTQEKFFRALAIHPNTLVSYRKLDLVDDKVRLCGRKGCFTPAKILRRSPYIFWKTTRKVLANPIRFHRNLSDITKSRCSLNGVTRNVNFKLFSAKKHEFGCQPGCKEADFVVCNGTLAGFLTGTATENVFKLDTVPHILKLVGESVDDIPGRYKRERASDDAAITTSKKFVNVTEADKKQGGGITAVTDVVDVPKPNAQKNATTNETNNEQLEPKEESAKTQPTPKSAQNETEPTTIVKEARTETTIKEKDDSEKVHVLTDSEDHYGEGSGEDEEDESYDDGGSADYADILDAIVAVRNKATSTDKSKTDETGDDEFTTVEVVDDDDDDDNQETSLKENVNDGSYPREILEWDVSSSSPTSLRTLVNIPFAIVLLFGSVSNDFVTVCANVFTLI